MGGVSLFSTGFSRKGIEIPRGQFDHSKVSGLVETIRGKITAREMSMRDVKEIVKTFSYRGIEFEKLPPESRRAILSGNLHIYVSPSLYHEEPDNRFVGYWHKPKGGLSGGFVELTATVGQNVYVDQRAKVLDFAQVLGNAVLFGFNCVRDMAIVSENAEVEDNAVVIGNAQVSGHAKITGHAVISDNASVSGHAVVNGMSVVGGNARILDNATVSDSEINGNAEVSKDAKIIGNSSIHGDIHVSSGALVFGARISWLGTFARPIENGTFGAVNMHGVELETPDLAKLRKKIQESTPFISDYC